MLKLASTLLTVALIAAPAVARTARQPLDFQRDGIHYVGTAITQPDGSMRLVGHEVQSGRDFALLVSRGRVTGEFGGEAVSYPVPTARAGTEIATAND